MAYSPDLQIDKNFISESNGSSRLEEVFYLRGMKNSLWPIFRHIRKKLHENQSSRLKRSLVTLTLIVTLKFREGMFLAPHIKTQLICAVTDRTDNHHILSSAACADGEGRGPIRDISRVLMRFFLDMCYCQFTDKVFQAAPGT